MAITFFVEMVLLYYDIAHKAFVFLLLYFSAYFLRMAFGKMFHTSNVIELSLAKNAQ